MKTTDSPWALSHVRPLAASLAREVRFTRRRCALHPLVWAIAGAGALLPLFSPAAAPAPPVVAEWTEYLGGPSRSSYSPLKQVTTRNVDRLTVAWEFHSADPGQSECNPIVVDGVLYGTTATNQVFALDAATGRELWRFKEEGRDVGGNQRGVTYWAEGNDRRLLFNIDEWLYAVDARTGKRIPGFGSNGRVSLRTGLGERARDKWVTCSSPGTVFENLVIMPSRVGELGDAAPGHLQAFDVRSGKLAWTFRTIPEPGEVGYETWPKEAYKNIDVGGANCWTGMAIDRARGIVYVPTGSAAPDFWGGNRKGENLFANCLLALDARTGQRRWHFQFVHHDIWDRDLPTPPTLLTVVHDQRRIDAVAQVTKSGHVFVFDRVTGQPLFPVAEVATPGGGTASDETWPTQPVPLRPRAFARQAMTEGDISDLAPNREDLVKEFRAFQRGPFIPFGKAPTLLVPGLQGGAEWGGAAADENGILYVNANELPYVAQLSEIPKAEGGARLSRGQRLYMFYCIACHGAERTGNPAGGVPTLLGLADRLPRGEAVALMATGRKMMPGYTSLSVADRNAIASFLYGDDDHAVAAAGAPEPAHDPAFESSDYAKFVDQNGYPAHRKFLDGNGHPAIKPPWGTLSAINLNTGEFAWQVTLGEFKELTAKGIPPTGAENYGGPLVTAGGLVFIAATKDGMFRAFDRATGRIVWEVELPAAGFATPATYAIGGKQYVVIAATGGKLGTKRGDSYIAYSLPDMVIPPKPE